MLINQGDYMPFYTRIVKWYISIQKSVPGSTKTLYLLVSYLHGIIIIILEIILTNDI